MRTRWLKNSQELKTGHWVIETRTCVCRGPDRKNPAKHRSMASVGLSFMQGPSSFTPHLRFSRTLYPDSDKGGLWGGLFTIESLGLLIWSPFTVGEARPQKCSVLSWTEIKTGNFLLQREKARGQELWDWSWPLPHFYSHIVYYFNQVTFL